MVKVKQALPREGGGILEHKEEGEQPLTMDSEPRGNCNSIVVILAIAIKGAWFFSDVGEAEADDFFRHVWEMEEESNWDGRRVRASRPFPTSRTFTLAASKSRGCIMQWT
jgi:hypothetical protein